MSSTRTRPGLDATGKEAIRLGILATCTIALAFGVLFASGNMKPSGLLVAGQQGPSIEVITEDFGTPSNPRPGYDGQQVYAIARAFPDLDAAAEGLDDPAYRATRIVMPALASPFPAGEWLVLALVLLGLVGIGLTVGAMADLIGRAGSNPRLALLAIPGVLLPLVLTTTEALAYGFAFTAVAFLDRRRLGPAIVLGVLAVLTRETALIVMLAASLGGVRRLGFPTILAGAVPALVLGGWTMYVHDVLPSGSPSRFAFLAVRSVSTNSAAWVVAIIVLAIIGAWTWRDIDVLWPIGLAFAVFPLFLAVDVLDPLALPRVAAPALVLGLTGIGRAITGHRGAAIRFRGSTRAMAD